MPGIAGIGFRAFWVDMYDDFQNRLLNEYKSDRQTEYLWAILWLSAGGYLCVESFRSGSISNWNSVDRSGCIIGALLICLGVIGLFAIPRRYVLYELKSSSNTTEKRRVIDSIAKGPRLLRKHINKDSALIELSGSLWRQYRIRIYYNGEGYFIHSTLVHYRFTSPLHLGFSARQTQRIVKALRAIDLKT